PNGKVDLRRPNSGQHRGSFFARQIEVQSDSRVVPVPFDWDSLPGGPKDSDGDGCSDDEDGCPLNPHKCVRGLAGCMAPETDGDDDGTPDIDDQCPLDPNNSVFNACGCLGTAGLQPAGTPCGPEACSGRA